MIAYFKDVKVIFDKAQILEDRDVNDEATWGIMSKHSDDNMKLEAQTFGNNMVQYYLEDEKKATETFDPAKTADQTTVSNGGDQSAAPAADANAAPADTAAPAAQ
jgi:hypothetical protein